MLFDRRPRAHYSNPQLREVICQIRFPSILSIGAKEPAAFQEAIRHAFPRYAVRQDQPAPQMRLVNGMPKLETPASVTNYHFISEDNLWKLNLTKDFISLSTLSYQGWEDFGSKLDLPLAQFIRIYQPAFFQRIGLRYVNLFSRRAMSLEDESWSDLFTAPYLGALAQEDVREDQLNHSAVNFDIALDSSCRAKVHAGPGKVKQANANAPKDDELKFVLDMDLYMGGEIKTMLSAGALETLHGHASPLFEGAITDTLRRAME